MQPERVTTFTIGVKRRAVIDRVRNTQQATELLAYRAYELASAAERTAQLVNLSWSQQMLLRQLEAERDPSLKKQPERYPSAWFRKHEREA
jgi:hypothetical protein